MIYYSGATLKRLPRLADGEMVKCPVCRGKHRVFSVQLQGNSPSPHQFYKCGEKTVLAGVDGRNVVGVKPDAVGEQALRDWKREDES